MQYITVYSTLDTGEISIIRNLFDQQEIKYEILGEATSSSAGIAASGISGMRVQVREKDSDRAKEILTAAGFLGNINKGHVSHTGENAKMGKGMIIFLAALVVILAAILFIWFMIPE